MTKVTEVMTLYAKELQAIQDFAFVYMNICLEFVTLVTKTVVEYPPVQKALEFIVTLTPEKVQAILVRSII